MNEPLPKIVVVAGPTASGKSALAVELARTFNGEVVSADSRQVYRGLDLGSGKITTSEMRGVPHHLLDVADPTTTYTAADFVRDGRAAIADILDRGALPIVAGGSCFYIDALLGRTALPAVPPDQKLRDDLEQRDTAALLDMLRQLDPLRAKAVDPHNRPRIIRAIEVARTLGAVPPLPPALHYQPYIIGIDVPREVLYTKIRTRIDERIKLGMIDEVSSLRAQGLSWERLDALGLEYRYIARHLRGMLTRAEMTVALERAIRHFAKRQMTWLRRDTNIHWFTPENGREMNEAVAAFIAD